MSPSRASLPARPRRRPRRRPTTHACPGRKRPRDCATIAQRGLEASDSGATARRDESFHASGGRTRESVSAPERDESLAVAGKRSVQSRRSSWSPGGRAYLVDRDCLYLLTTV